MSIINLETIINAPIEICFDLSRSVELHIISTAHTNEKAIAGRITGLCKIGDIITWRAKHFGVYQKLTVQITQCDFPSYFEDRMIKGAFKSFTHQHFFQFDNNQTLMKDVFEYEAPYGVFGKVFNKLVLYRYMKALLVKRNIAIKDYAESVKWKILLEKV